VVLFEAYRQRRVKERRAAGVPDNSAKDASKPKKLKGLGS
jgi:hypothetical protein